MNYFGPERGTVMMVLTDSIELYGSRPWEFTAERGKYTAHGDTGASNHGRFIV